MRTPILSLLLIFGSASAVSAAVSPGSIRTAAAYSANHGGKSFLALQHGKTILEKSAQVPHRIYSGTKAFWCLAALAAVEDGILDLDERVGSTLPSWRNDPRKTEVTIRQLLDFSAGLEPMFQLHSNNARDRDRSAVGGQIVALPGSAFIYGPSALQVFHQVLKVKLRRETPTQYLERRVLRRLHLGPQRHLNDSNGNPLLAAGWEMSARQWAKLGELVLENGSPVIRSSSLAQFWRGSSANLAFSLGWWNNRAAPGGREFDFEDMLAPKWPQQNWRNACLCRDAPDDLVACIGSGYQRLYVIPSLGLVVVRHGSGKRFSDAQFLRLLLSN